MAGRPKAAITRAEFSKLLDRITSNMPRIQEPAVRTNGNPKSAGKNDKIKTAIAAKILQVVGYDCRLAAGPVDYRDESSLGRGEHPQVWPLGNWPFVVFPDGNVVDVCGNKRSPVFVQLGKILWGRPFIVHNSLAYDYAEAPGQTKALEKIAADYFAVNPQFDQQVLNVLEELREEKSPEAKARREAGEKRQHVLDELQGINDDIDNLCGPFEEGDLEWIEDIRLSLGDLEERILRELNPVPTAKPKRKTSTRQATPVKAVKLVK